MPNCGKVVQKTVKKLAKKLSNLIVQKSKLVYKNIFSHTNKRVLSSFAQLFLTTKKEDFNLLKMSFTRFPHSSTNTTINIRNY